MNIPRQLMLALGLICTLSVVGADSFYKEPYGIFSTRPDAKKSLQTIKRFGPVGLGIDLIQPAFTMRIANVEEGSPAAATGKLAKGQIIDSINGRKLADIDPRIQFGQLLAQAEATDGLLKFTIRGVAAPVTVQVPVLGAYSKTWPLNCPKSDKIVRQVADYLSQPDAQKGLAGIGVLFLLSTGEAKDLAVAREWARSVKPHRYPWYIGYGGIPLAEAYLRTGDPVILANIQAGVDNAVATQYLGGWLGRGGVTPSYGNGHLNAAGTHVLTFLLLAKECGAKVPDQTLDDALVHFYRYAGRGGNPYGDNRPEYGFVDNGKNGLLAFAMAAAAALTPNGEQSVYARARDVCAMQSFYTTSFMLHGHTGGGIGEIWRSASMGLLHEKKPRQYRDFMDQRQWHYDLSRRFDGSFGILGGAGYDKEQWGVAYPLAYTIPRKTLRITGAAPTQFSKLFKLPELPWGTEADNAFFSLEAAADADGHKQDLSRETLAADSSKAILIRLHNSGEVSDDLLRKYVFHQDHNIRFVAANKVLGINSGYIGWRSPGGSVRKALMLELLRHQDPRVRRAMFGAINKRPDVLDREVFDLAVHSVKDPKESWWVKDAALQIIGKGSADWVTPHIDLLLPYLRHSDWWLQNAALTALTPVAADTRCYQRVLPAMGELIRSNQRTALTRGLMPSIRARIKAAGPEVQALATATLKETYTGFIGVKTTPGGQDVTSTYDAHLGFIAASLADVPGGLDVLYEISREKFPSEILPYKEFYLKADSSRFGPSLREAIPPIITGELIPEYVGRNRTRLHQLAAAEIQSGYPGGSRDAIDGLAALYDRAGDKDYDWNMFMDLRNAEWSYHSFDPIAAEQVPFDQLVTRYRPVTLPKGLEDWFAPAHKSALWKRGKSPFGHFKGKLPIGPVHKCGPSCVGPGCYGATKVNSFWEREVLLLRGTFKVPPLKAGHRYRLRVNDGNHVGSGGGHLIYVNGKPLIETKTCNGRGSGGLPKGAYITGDFLDDFRKGEVTLAAVTFLRFNDKYKVKPSSKDPQGKFSLHLEEQKLPPMGDELVYKSATLVPMLSMEWQVGQDPEDREKSATARKYRWDGQVVANPDVLGNWKVLTMVAAIEDFDSTRKTGNARNPLFTEITFQENGRTKHPTLIWSGDTLMDLSQYQALKIVARTLDGTRYLFVEAGGFGTRNKPGWKPKLLVLARD